MQVSIPEALTLNTKVKVGIEADFDFILGMVKMSGVILGECKIGAQAMKGAMIANPGLMMMESSASRFPWLEPKRPTFSSFR